MLSVLDNMVWSIADSLQISEIVAAMPEAQMVVETANEASKSLTILVGIIVAFASVGVQLSMDMGFFNPEEKLEIVRRFRSKSPRKAKAHKNGRKEFGGE